LADPPIWLLELAWLDRRACRLVLAWPSGSSAGLADWLTCLPRLCYSACLLESALLTGPATFSAEAAQAA
jgi:hypothetical protein